MVKKLFVFTTLLIFTTSAFTQSVKFSEKAESFVDELNEQFKTSADKKASKEFIDEFEVFWGNPILTPQLKKLIMETCNRQAAKKARPFPDYYTYLTTIMAFINTGHDAESFNQWNMAMTAQFNKQRYELRHFNSILALSKDLVINNILFSTPSVSWKCSKKAFRYEFKDDKLAVIVAPTNLVCHSKNDSLTIFDTQGTFYPLEEMWYGTKGRITWERSGFEANMVYANFKNYSIKLDQNSFTIDSVEFYNKHYFSYPLNGRLDDKVMAINSPEGTIYPKFTSTNQRFEIKNIQPSINYEGGFAQYGAKFLGAGTEKEPAVISVYRRDTLFLTAKSQYFALRKDQILSNTTEIKIKLDTAHIYHPGLIFKYMADLQEIHLIRQGEGLAMSPYFDTFHNVSIDAELIKWKVGDQWMDLKMLQGAAENQSFFESLSYFREEFYNRLQGMDAIHPLQALKNCSNYFHGQPFSVKEYADYMRLPDGQLRQQIIGLSFYGFVEYNVDTDMVIVNDRLKDFLLFRIGKKDYDVIRFNSLTPSNVSNARLDLKNFDLNMEGVSSISISDNQNVVFFPRNKKISLKENRNFVFDGVINAGMLNLFGNGFKFSYEKYQIDMSNIDSMKMKVRTGDLDYFGQSVLKNVENTINNLSGNLKIDEPNNKSGTKRNPQYPILNSEIESYVYFDNKSIQKGAYKRDKFFFTLDPFVMDSINTLKPDNFDFSGDFVSNIFPTIRENLKIRPDYSLGFKRKTPPEGYPIYNKKATYFSNIDLSNAGLKGNGTLNYVTSTSKSESFTFLPDKVTGQASDFTVELKTKAVEFPDVKGKFVNIDYRPEQNALSATSLEEDFEMYKNEANLNGELKVTPYGLNGKGAFFMKNAALRSPKFTFASRALDADSSNFTLTAGDVEGVSFATSNLASHIDFDTREGYFRSLVGGSKVEFTDNRYISFISNFSWHMDKNDIFMGTRGTKGNRFVSTHKKQDSLSFYVPLARYDVGLKTIFAEEVKNIEVADADLKISDGFVTIREDAVIDPLDKVYIVLKDTTTNHILYDAHINILGKKSYTGYGKYDFMNGANKTEMLSMHKIEVDDKGRTIAESSITEKDFFTFDSHFAFKGTATLKATDKNLFFNGGAQMLHSCSQGIQSYLRFNTQIDPNKVRIPVNKSAENFVFEQIYKDFFITKDSTHIYSSFLESRKDYSDIPMITGLGYLMYNETNRSFDIASEAKINNPDTIGNLIRYSEADCNIMAEGAFDIGIDLDQVKTRNSGTLIDVRSKNQIMVTSMMSIDFFFNKDITSVLYTMILNSKAKASTLTSTTFTKRLAEWDGTKTALLMDEQRTTIGMTEGIPDELQSMFLFSNIDMIWDTYKRSYISDGKADLAFLKNYGVDKAVNVKMLVTGKRSGNSLDMYLEFDSENWVFFSYKNSMMQTLSSSPEYNTMVQGLKAEERKLKVGIGEKSYSFILAPESKKKRFLSIMNNQQVGDEEELPEEVMIETEADTKPNKEIKDKR